MKTNYKIIKHISRSILLMLVLSLSGCVQKDGMDGSGEITDNTVFDPLESMGAISITSLSSLTGMTGDTIIIKGLGFEAKEKDPIKIIFGGDVEEIARVVSSSEIRIAVPDTLSKGKVKVWIDQNKFAFSPLPFELIPLNITSFSPLSASPNDVITITGTGFKTGLKVFFNENVEAAIVVVNATTINATVPSANVNGKITVWQNTRKKAMSGQTFMIETSLTMASFTPLRAKSGDIITITGTGFKPGEINKVYFGSSSIEGDVTISSTTTLTVIVPAGDINGPIKIWQRTGREVISATSLQQIFAPVVTSLSSQIGAPGGNITIAGDYFSTVSTDVKVFFGATEGIVSSTSKTSISVTIPTLSAKDARTTVKVKNIGDNEVSNMTAFVAWDPAKSFSDKFNRANTDWSDAANSLSVIGSDWKAFQGNFKIQDNYLSSQTNAKMTYTNIGAALSPGKGFNFSSDVKFEHPTDPSSFTGLIFNVQTDGQSYQLVRFNGAGLVQVLSTTNNSGGWAGVHSGGVSTSQTMVGNNYYHFEISSEGTSTIHLRITKIDGTLLTDTDINVNPGITGGKVGFWNQGDLGRYDNFSLLVN